MLQTSFPLSINSEVITIPLSDGDNSDLEFILNNFVSLGRYRNSTYITLPEGVIKDAQGIALEPVSDPIQSSNEPGDLVPPELNSFNLNLNTGVMTLTFSETIQESWFDLTTITIQPMENGGTGYSLTNGSVIPISNTQFMVNLSSTDVNNLQALTDIGTDESNTYISLERGLASDSGSLHVLPIPSTAALQVVNFTGDQNPPSLVGFELSLSGSEPMILTFSETVLVSTLLIDRIFLLSEPSSSAVEFAFTEWTVLSTDGPVIEIELSVADKGSLQQLPDLATSIENTYIRVTEGAVKDSDGRAVIGLSRDEAIQASKFTPDILPPSLIQFTIDMDSGLLVLTADEPVDGATFVSTAYTLQNSEMAPSVFFSLTEDSELIRITDFTIITVAIGDDDLNMIKALDICTTNTTCFLTYADGAIADTFGETAENITTGLSPSEFTADTTKPRLLRFDVFSRATGIVNLTFTETIRSSSFDPSQVTLQSFTSGPSVTTYTLSGGKVTDSPPTVTLTLTDEDMAGIRLNPFVCISRGNCYITLTASTLTDIAGNALTAESSGLLADRFVFDDIPPVLNNFTLDVNSGELTLTFSEPVSAEVFDVEGITLQDSRSSPNSSYQLTSSSLTSSDNGVEILVSLSNYDLNHIKESQLALNDKIFIALTEDVTRDLALVPNQLMPTEVDNALQVQGFVGDNDPPELQQLVLDLTEDTIQLVLDEPINTTAIAYSEIFLGLSPTTPIISLDGANLTSTMISSTVSVTFSLAPETIISLKSNSNFGTDSTNTYLILNQGAVIDFAGNVASQVETLDANVVYPDTTNPLLIRFVLNLESDALELTFNDVVDPRDFDPTGITLQGSQFRADSGAYYTLTSASTALTTASGFLLNVSLSTDAQVIRENQGLGTSIDDTYITMLASTIDSPSGMDNAALTDGKALQASNVIFDRQPPMLQSFDLDLDEGLLIMSFNDFIDEDSVQLTHIVIQDQELATPGITYRLTDSSTVSVALDKLTVYLSDTDLNGIKSTEGLATSSSNTYLRANSTALTDISGIELVAVLDGAAEKVSSFTADTTRPSVESFVLDLDSGIISLTFDEFVDLSSLDTTQIFLQSRADSNAGLTNSVTLSGSQPIEDTNTDELQLRLPISTLTDEFSDTFGSLRTNTFLTLTLFAASDLGGLPVQQISSSNGLMASDVTPDLNPPTLVAFDLDLGESLLTLSWSKPVLDSTLDFSRLQVQNMAASSPTRTRAVSSNSVTGGEDGSVIEIMLTYDDSTFLKETSNIADSRATTFISVGASAVKGALGNRESTEILPDNALQVKTFTADRQPPGVVAFNLDLNANSLIITFDERLADVTPTAIQFQDSESSVNYTFTDSSHVFSNNLVTLSLGPADQDGIKSNPGFLTNSVIALLSGSATDTSGNEVTTTEVYEVIGAITQDMIRPVLDGFDLDLSREILSLSFSEVVDTSSIQLSELTIQNMRSVNPSSPYVLTNSSSVRSTLGRVVEVHLIGNDAINIKANSALATATDNTYIVVDSNFIADFAGNPVVAIDVSNALPAT